MKALAKDKTEGARQSKRAYKALSRIEEADAKVHKSHRAYESSVATNELTKKRADVKHAKNLHALRPGYARLGVGLEKAETDAAARIEAIRTKLLGGTDK
jgi:methylphosphotriester-DNA--protein-cysteine methyltransferase